MSKQVIVREAVAGGLDVFLNKHCLANFGSGPLQRTLAVNCANDLAKQVLVDEVEYEVSARMRVKLGTRI